MTSKHHTTFKIPPISRLSPASIVLVYALVGILSILLSDTRTARSAVSPFAMKVAKNRRKP